MRISQAGGVLLAGLLMVGSSGCRSDEYPLLAQVLLVNGDAKAFVASGALQPLGQAQTLAAGSRIAVGPGGVAGLSLTPGALALLDQQTKMTLDQLEMRKTGHRVASRRASVTLREGTARFSVGAPPERRIELEVVAATAGRLSADPGAVFGVAAHGQSARVVCAKGCVRWTDAADATAGWVQAGQFADFGAPRGDGSWGKRREAAEDAAASQEIADLLAAGVRLNALLEAQRTLTPFRP